MSKTSEAYPVLWPDETPEGRAEIAHALSWARVGRALEGIKGVELHRGENGRVYISRAYGDAGWLLLGSRREDDAQRPTLLAALEAALGLEEGEAGE